MLKTQKVKKMAFIVGGWHYPKHFYEMIGNQVIPDGWEVDLFCLGHREPPGPVLEKQEIWDRENKDKLLYELDRMLYQEFVTKEDLARLNFKFLLEENTMGDFEFLNQWLKKNDYKKYDIIGTAHDDNFIMNVNLFNDVLTDKIPLYQKDPENGTTNIPAKNRNWLILSHATAVSYYHIRCTFDFFKKEAIKLSGNGFDSSSITLTREGETNTPTSHEALMEWNKWTDIMIKFIEQNKLQSKVKFISPYYRVSQYCIECERGFVHRTGWAGDQFIAGINWLLKSGIIRMVNKNVQ